MKRTVFLPLALALGLAGQLAWGGDDNAIDDAAVRKHIERVLPGFEVDAIRPAPIPGFHEVAIGTRITYISDDGNYLILGDVVDTAKLENLSEARRAELTAGKINSFDAAQMIVIGPGEAKRHITVFTDVDCPYCSKFHRDVPALNDAGLEVRYLLFPRTGVGSKSYKRAVGVWCADDRIEMVGVAKAGGAVAEKQCDNPVDEHLTLGRQVGVSGTPAIVLDDGRMIPGYVPPQRLLAQMGMVPEDELAKTR